MVLARRHQGFECFVLLFYELGAVQDNNVWHRRPLRRKPVLPWASGTAEATPSPVRPKRFGVSTPERLERGKQGAVERSEIYRQEGSDHPAAPEPAVRKNSRLWQGGTDRTRLTTQRDRRIMVTIVVIFQVR